MGLEEIAAQVPALAVLVGLVIGFLKYLAIREKAQAQLQRDWMEVIRDNSRVLGEVHSTLKQLNGKHKE